MLGYLTVALLTCAPVASWESNYGKAQQHAIRLNRPLAVVFGSGPNRWTQLQRTDNAALQVDQMLAEHYVCVYLDTKTPHGMKMAQAFQITRDTGLVISDRSGSVQAFWHEGDMTNEQLIPHLARHADVKDVVMPIAPADPKKATKAETIPVARPAYRPTATTYSQGQQDAIRQKRPLAVVFGSGANGWTKILSTESPAQQIERILAEQYVCVYIDTDTAEGKKTSQAFGITNRVGLVISDRSANTQAFWHQGELTKESMTHYLTRYADAQVAVTQTETVESSRISYYPGSVGYPRATYSYGSSTMSSANC